MVTRGLERGLDTTVMVGAFAGKRSTINQIWIQGDFGSVLNDAVYYRVGIRIFTLISLGSGSFRCAAFFHVVTMNLIVRSIVNDNLRICPVAY